MPVHLLFTAVGLLQLLILSGCAAQSASPPQGEQTVAVIADDVEITFGQLQKFAVDRFYDGSSVDRAGSYRRALDRMIVNEMRWRDFFAHGLHDDADLVKRIGRTLNEELVLVYFQTKYVEPYVNETAIEEAHQLMGRAVHFEQVYIPRAGPDDADLDALRSRLEDAASELAATGDAEGVAQRLRESTGAHVIPGRGEPVTWYRSLASRVEEVIFDLPVGATRAFESDDAFSIVRVVDVETRPVPSLAQVRDQIVDALRNRYMPYVVEQYEEEKDRLIDSSGVQWHDAGVDRIVRWGRDDGFFERAYGNVIEEELRAGNNFSIVTIEDRLIDLEEYKRLLDEVLIMRSGESIDVDDVQGHILEAVRTEMIADRARELGLHRRILHPDSDNPVIRNRLVWLYDQHFIENSLPAPDEALLRDFYESNTDSLFYQFETINSYVLRSTDREEAEQWMAQIQDGVDLEAVTGSYLVRSFYRNHDGAIQSLYSIEPPYLGEAVFGLSDGEVDGPVEYTSAEGTTYYAVVKNANYRSARVLEFDEVASRVPSAFRDYHWNRMEAELHKDLRNRYSYRINEEVLVRELEARNIRSAALAKERPNRN